MILILIQRSLVFGLLNEKKNEEGKQGKYLVKEDIRSAREMKHREGKGGNIWKGKIAYYWRRKKRKKILEEGNILFMEGICKLNFWIIIL